MFTPPPPPGPLILHAYHLIQSPSPRGLCTWRHPLRLSSRMSCLAPCACCSLPLWVSCPPTGTIPISGAPSQSLGGASFKAFEPKRGWQFGSSLTEKDDLGSSEAPPSRNRDGRVAQVTRQNLMRVSHRVNNHPHFLHLAHSFCRAARGRW